MMFHGHLSIAFFTKNGDRIRSAKICYQRRCTSRWTGTLPAEILPMQNTAATLEAAIAADPERVTVIHRAVIRNLPADSPARRRRHPSSMILPASMPRA